MIAVYVILANDGTYYTGITCSIVKRWREHKAHQSSYFKYRSPVLLQWIRFYDSYANARKVERWIKSIGAKKFMCKFP